MKKRILFVDGEPDGLDGLRRMLRTERDRWDMSFVDGADPALDQMRVATFDDVVADVNLPGKDGFVFLVETLQTCVSGGWRAEDHPQRCGPAL